MNEAMMTTTRGGVLPREDRATQRARILKKIFELSDHELELVIAHGAVLLNQGLPQEHRAECRPSA